MPLAELTFWGLVQVEVQDKSSARFATETGSHFEAGGLVGNWEKSCLTPFHRDSCPRVAERRTAGGRSERLSSAA